jgi:biopolymer transport protein TolR
MGMQVEQGGDGGRSQSSGTVLSEINVTPFVDVMLVLLIIFMVTAPMLTQGMELDLPRVRGETLIEDDQHPLVMEIDAEGRLYLNQHEFTLAEMELKLPAIYAQRSRKELFIRADGAVTWDYLAQVMAAARLAGIAQVGMVTETAGYTDEDEEAE